MADLQTLMTAIDKLPPDQLETLRQYIEQRRRATWGIILPDRLDAIDKIMRPVQADAETMTEDEINQVIDEAIGEVRRGQPAPNRD